MSADNPDHHHSSLVDHQSSRIDAELRTRLSSLPEPSLATSTAQRVQTETHRRMIFMGGGIDTIGYTVAAIALITTGWHVSTRDAASYTEGVSK